MRETQNTYKRRALVVAVVTAYVLVIAVWLFWPLMFGPDPSPVSGMPESEFIDISAKILDHDGDGILDPRDIVVSARAYTATRPRYGSAYYEGGVPTDGRGVCTDLLAAALKGAGWDLQALVDEDIKADPEAYEVDVPDPNIDYRRVRNVAVYLERHTTSLSLDPHDAAAWRAGDIAVFRDHVAVVSDVRRPDGVPYLIHHDGPLPRAFEEDILTARSDLVGHYRMQ